MKEVFPVRITWRDSSHFPGWNSPENVGEILKDDLLIETFGLLIEETEDRVVITSSLSSSGNVISPLVIPKSAISFRKEVNYE